MAEVQNVKAAVGDDKFFARSAKLFSPFRQFAPRDDFISEVHAASLPVQSRLANMKNKMSGFAFGVHLPIDSRDG